MNAVSWIGDVAVGYAHTLAEKDSAELHVLHIAANSNEAAVRHGIAGTSEPRADDSSEHKQWRDAILGENGTIKRIDVIQIGADVSQKIIAYANAQQIDLIVMASHGRSGLSHFWLGSVAEQVIRSASCPVLVLRPRPEELACESAKASRCPPHPAV
jgi:nucleotide-binding universal stress UspA family protein